MKARLAALYMPVIGIVIDSLPQLWDPNVEGRLKSFNFESDADKINQHIAMEIAGSSVFAGRVQENPSYDGSKVSFICNVQRKGEYYNCIEMKSKYKLLLTGLDLCGNKL